MYIVLADDLAEIFGSAPFHYDFSMVSLCLEGGETNEIESRVALNERYLGNLGLFSNISICK